MFQLCKLNLYQPGKVNFKIDDSASHFFFSADIFCDDVSIYTVQDGANEFGIHIDSPTTPSTGITDPCIVINISVPPSFKFVGDFLFATRLGAFDVKVDLDSKLINGFHIGTSSGDVKVSRTKVESKALVTVVSGDVFLKVF
jgi:hypothetical protein